MSTSQSPWSDVELLTEPTRRRIYDALRAVDGPLTREQVAAAVGIAVQLAAFHLDRLAGAGLLTVDYARPAGRTGPGAGRPAKRYTPAGREVSLSVPPRRPDVVARLLAAAVATSPQDAGTAALAIAREEGHRIGSQHRGAHAPTRGKALSRVEQTLATAGYEPTNEGGRLRLRNCPFHGVVDVAPGLVCGLNHALVGGVLAGLGVEAYCAAHGDGTPPDCCVSIRS